MAKGKPKTKGIFHPNGKLRVEDPEVKSHLMAGKIAELEAQNNQINEQILHLHLAVGKNNLCIESLKKQAGQENLQLEFDFTPPEDPTTGHAVPVE